MGFFNRLWGFVRKEATQDTFALLVEAVMSLRDRKITPEEKEKIKNRIIALLEDI